MRIIAFSLLLPALVSGQSEAQEKYARSSGCFFTKYFGSNTGTLDDSGVEDFSVVAGAGAYCTTTCVDGKNTILLNNFGSAPTGTGDTSSQSTDDCTLIARFTSDTDETSLGWSIQAEDYEFLSLTCFCTDDGEGNDFNDGEGLGCFSESAVVQVQGKGDVLMKELVVGDKVLTGKNNFQPVYSFGHHKENSIEMKFFQIYTDSSANDPLEMTGNHMIFVVDENGHANAIRADQVLVGDHVRKGGSSGETVAVTKIETTQKTGLYMPLTPDGTIVVNGLVASNYISISDTAPGVVEHSQMFFPMTEQTLSHWWMSPFRMLCMGVSSGFCSSGYSGSSAYEVEAEDEGILPFLLMGRHFAHVAENQPTLVRFVMGVPTFLLFGMFNFVEHVFFGPSLAPFLFIMAIAFFITMKKVWTNNKSEFEQDAGYSLLSAV